MQAFWFRFLPLAALSVTGGLSAQVVPTTPKSFDTKRIGDTLNSGSVGLKTASPTGLMRVTTHVVLSPFRAWTNQKGTIRHGQLIGWNDVVKVVDTSESVALQPELPDLPPTTANNGQVRLLIGGKAFVVALDSLCEADQKFISDVQTAIDKGNVTIEGKVESAETAATETKATPAEPEKPAEE